MAAIEYLALRIPPDLKRLLEKESEETDKSLNTIAREILEHWFYPCDLVPIHQETPRVRRRTDAKNH